jgi:hypothetical protein
MFEDGFRLLVMTVKCEPLEQIPKDALEQFPKDALLLYTGDMDMD